MSSLAGREVTLPTFFRWESYQDDMSMSQGPAVQVLWGLPSDILCMDVNTVDLESAVRWAKTAESLSTLGCPGKSAFVPPWGYDPIHPQDIFLQILLDKRRRICVYRSEDAGELVETTA